MFYYLILKKKRFFEIHSRFAKGGRGKKSDAQALNLLEGKRANQTLGQKPVLETFL